MVKHLLFTAVLLLVLIAGSVFTRAESLVFTNGFLIDGTGAGPEAGITIIIEGDRIKEIGKNLDLPSGAEIIDLRGAAVLPGIINAHIHDGFNEDNLKAWLEAGVTTVRDMSCRRLADPFKTRDRLNQNNSQARLVSVGPMLTTVNGYGSLAVTSLEDARKTVKDLIERGTDLIKVGIEDRQGSNRWPLISLEELRAMVETAHQHGIKVTAHVTRLHHLKLALEGKVDELAHMVYNPVSSETLDYIVSQNIYWVPTLELWEGISKIYDPSLVRIAVDNLRNFVSKGGRVALGTDYDGYYFDFQLGMPMLEMELMQEAGMSNMEIITAATRNAACVCQLGDQLGTLEEGKIADILIVDGNPLSDLQDLLQVKYVVHNGELVVDKRAD